MKLPSKKIPPPPTRPGTHTNEEVREALHARAVRRKIIVSAVVVLLIGCLLVISNIASEYENPSDKPSKPKMLFIVASDLDAATLNASMTSTKAPFMRLLNATGGAYGDLDVLPGAPGSPLVKLLTGSATTTRDDLIGETSFLRKLVAGGFKTVVAAPASLWSTVSTATSSTSSPSNSGSDAAAETSSGAAATAVAECPHVGLFDSECSGNACPTATEAAYCNAHTKYLTCDNVAQLFQYELVSAFNHSVRAGADALLFYAHGLSADEDKLSARSSINLLDNALGQIALALSARTREHEENWLIVVAGVGRNEARTAPLMLAAYSRGGLIQLRQLHEPTPVSLVYSTVLKWFGVSGYTDGDVRGICSGGAVVTNCDP